LRRSNNGDPFLAAQTLGRLGGSVIHQHFLLGDELLNPSAAGFSQMSDEKLIEPLTGVVRGNRNRDGKL
jgi:hypothetical protein